MEQVVRLWRIMGVESILSGRKARCMHSSRRKEGMLQRMIGRTEVLKRLQAGNGEGG